MMNEGRFHRVVEYRVVREPLAVPHGARCQGSSALAAVARDVIPDDGREHMLVVGMDVQFQVLLVHQVSMGSSTMTIVHPREVFAPAVRESVHSIAVAHNHPSGVVRPSREDVALSLQLLAVGTVLNIDVADFIIMSHANATVWSALESGVVTTQTKMHMKAALGRTASALLRRTAVASGG